MTDHERYLSVTAGLDEDQIHEVATAMLRPQSKEQVAVGRRFARAAALRVGNARDRRRARRAVDRWWDKSIDAATRGPDYDWYEAFAAARKLGGL